MSSGAAVSKTVWAQGSQYTSPLTPWQDKTFLQNDLYKCCLTIIEILAILEILKILELKIDNIRKIENVRKMTI